MKIFDDIRFFAEEIIYECNRMTSGNYMHNSTHVRACADAIIRMIKEVNSKLEE